MEEPTTGKPTPLRYLPSTLRDYFIGQALTGLCSVESINENVSNHRIAEQAVEMADEVMKARVIPLDLVADAVMKARAEQ